MNSGQYNITCEQYATFSLVITWTDANNNPINLTSYSALMDVKDTGGNLILQLSTSNSRITLGGSAGTITLSIAATDTSALTPGAYSYDLLLTSAGGIVTRLIEGGFSVEAGVTP